MKTVRESRAEQSRQGEPRSRGGRPPIEPGGVPLRFPMQLSGTMRQGVEEAAKRETGGNVSGWVRNQIKASLNPIPVWGEACCGVGLHAQGDEPLAHIRSMRDLLPRSNDDADYYLLVAEGSSMQHPADPRRDIRNGDLLLFLPREDVDNGQIVHYETADDFGEHTCGVRYFRQDENGIVTLSASNTAVEQATQERLYPDIVLPRDRVIIRGIWQRVIIRGVRV